ncbi:MAG TPA: protease HtpX, partial [Sulfuricaulis sp.]|nr:protease HtpX [Sulfuricaulis sp.]
MKRIALFLATNLAIIIVLSISLRLLGVDSLLEQQGGGLNFNALLVFAAVFGMGGAFLSLAISKWTAKRLTGAQVIEQPANDAERWLVETVRRQARAAGIDMPEVAIYEAPEVNAFATGMRRNAALVAVSTGLLGAMHRDETEAVLAHEVSHVANGDMVTLALIQGVVNTFVIFLS